MATHEHVEGEALGMICRATATIEVCTCGTCRLVVVREECQDAWHRPADFVICRERAVRASLI